MTDAVISFEEHYEVNNNHQKILDILSDACPQLSRQKLKQAMQYGAVWLTHNNKTTRIRRVKKALNAGDTVHLYYNPAILFSDIQPASLISDEGEYSIWNKPCGMFSQGTKWGDHSSIARWVELFGLKKNQLTQKPTFLVHRLDRATSGLIIVAHSKQATRQLAEIFESRKIDKHYTAAINGKYPSDISFQELNTDIDNKPALSKILSSEYLADKNQTVLMIKIETGRKHQIRKHLSAVGYPIIGDRLYGEISDSEQLQPDLMLRCCLLQFECPFTQVKQTFSLSAADGLFD